MGTTQSSSLTASEPTQSSSSSSKGKRRAATEVNDDSEADDASPKSCHQRSQSGVSSGSDRRKVWRISAGQGLVTGASTLGEYLSNAVDKLASAAFRANPEATPQAGPSNTSSSAAYAAIEADEGLSDIEMSAVGEILRKEPDIGVAYLAMSKPSVRTYYLQARLEDYRNQK